MNWKREAEEELKNYRYIKNTVENLTERLKINEARMLGLKSAAADSTPIVGGGNRYEDNLINCMVEKGRLTRLLEERSEYYDLIRKGLDALNEREALTVQRFYIDGISYASAVDCLREELGYEEAQLNRIRRSALYHYTIAMYGTSES